MCPLARAIETSKTSRQLLPTALTYFMKLALSKFCDCGETRVFIYVSDMVQSQQARNKPGCIMLPSFVRRTQMPDGKLVVPAEE